MIQSSLDDEDNRDIHIFQMYVVEFARVVRVHQKQKSHSTWVLVLCLASRNSSFSFIVFISYLSRVIASFILLLDLTYFLVFNNTFSAKKLLIPSERDREL